MINTYVLPYKSFYSLVEFPEDTYIGSMQLLFDDVRKHLLKEYHFEFDDGTDYVGISLVRVLEKTLTWEGDICLRETRDIGANFLDIDIIEAGFDGFASTQESNSDYDDWRKIGKILEQTKRAYDLIEARVKIHHGGE